ncbi:hypothetical protein ACFL1E_04765 [Candidatus Omnitrophota bacterium]
MGKDSAPEEKLLNLIRRKRKPKEAAGKDSVKADMYISHLKTTYQKARPSEGSIRKEEIGIAKFKIVQKALIVVIVVSFIYILFVFLTPFGLESKQPVVTEVEPESTQVQIETAQPFSYYSEQFEKRDIFKSRFFDTGDLESYGTDNLEKLLSAIKVVGIIVDETPQVIIEDTKEKKTYFLNEGDFFNQFLVEEIQEGKAILSLEGEQIELIP